MSNLLKKASIITTPTAYDDGRILSVKPSENLYGPELVTNGDFSNGTTGWSSPDYNSTLSIVNGQMKIVSTLSLGRVSQAITTEVGKKYLISATTTNIDSSTGTQIKVSNAANLDGATYSSEFNATTNPLTITHRFIATATTTYIGSSQGSSVGQSALLDNVSVVEDLSGDFDFSRGSAATRVNAQGLVENVQILSSELVQNGNFSEIGSEEVSNGDFSQEGSELITNGDFATDSNWAKGAGWVIENGKATHIGGSSNSYLNQTNRTVVGKNYKAVFTFSGGLNSNNHVMVYGVGLYADFYEYTSDGTYTLYFTADATFFRFRAINPDNDVSIDNVSVVEVGQDWIFGTGWSIGEDEAISDGSQSTISDLEQNITLNQGSIYLVEFDLIRSAGTLYPKVGDTTGTGLTSTQSVSQTIVAGSSNKLELRADVNFIGSITNISVKEVLQDWASINANIYLSNNQLVVDDTANLGVDSRAYQTVPTIIGAKYRLTFDRISTTSSFWLAVGSGNPSPYKNIFYQQLGTDTGIYELEFVALTTTTTISLITGGTGISIFDNVSLLQVTDDTDLPRINYEGFSYQDVLGSELVVNGDFLTNTTTGWNSWSNLTRPENTKQENGYGILDATSGTCDARQDVTVIAGKSYKITVTMYESAGGNSRMYMSDGANYNYTFGQFNATETETTFQKIVQPTQSIIRLYTYNTSGKGYFKNVSVKEITGQEVVPNSGCGSWLFEPQSTNLYPYSQTITSGGLTFFTGGSATATLTNNYSISPDGTQNALRFQATVLNDIASRAAVRSSLSTSAVMSTVSVYAKSNTNENYTMIFHYEGGVRDTFVVTPEWQRFSFSEVSDATNNVGVELRGTYTSLEADVSLWGFQFENQSYATSVIPTDGAASTRLQDIANNSGNSDLISSTEGVLYAEIATNEDTINKFISLSDGTDDNRVTLYVHKTTNDEITCQVKNNNSEQFSRAISVNVLDFNKAAISFKENLCKFFVNGLQVGTTDTSATLPSGLNTLEFAKGDKNEKFFGKTKALVVFKEALTDTELELLTAPAPEFPTFTLDFDTIAEQFTFTRGSEATFVNEQGLIQSTASNDAPRIDYSTGVEAFLLEPQSTNLVSYSIPINSSPYNYANGGVSPAPIHTANQGISPDGSLNAAKIDFNLNGGTTSSDISQMAYVGSSLTGNYTSSFYLKSFDSNSYTVTLLDPNGVTSQTVITPEWQRFTFYNGGGTTSTNLIRIRLRGNENTSDTASLLAWGFQLEQKSYATSYIPTDGASATRNQETCSDATPTINSEEGTLYAEISALVDDETARNISISSGNNENTIRIQYRNGISNTIRVQVRAANTLEASLGYVTDIKDYHKVAISYRLNEVKLFVDGVLISTDTTALMPLGLNSLSFNQGVASSPFFGNTKGLQVFDKALSDYQLKQLTTI